MPFIRSGARYLVWGHRGWCLMITPTIILSLRLPTSKIFLLCPPSALPQSIGMPCVAIIDQPLKELNGLGQPC